MAQSLNNEPIVKNGIWEIIHIAMIQDPLIPSFDQLNNDCHHCYVIP